MLLINILFYPGHDIKPLFYHIPLKIDIWFKLIALSRFIEKNNFKLKQSIFAVWDRTFQNPDLMEEFWKCCKTSLFFHCDSIDWKYLKPNEKCCVNFKFFHKFCHWKHKIENKTVTLFSPTIILVLKNQTDICIKVIICSIVFQSPTSLKIYANRFSANWSKCSVSNKIFHFKL